MRYAHQNSSSTTTTSHTQLWKGFAYSKLHELFPKANNIMVYASFQEFNKWLNVEQGTLSYCLDLLEIIASTSWINDLYNLSVKLETFQAKNDDFNALLIILKLSVLT